MGGGHKVATITLILIFRKFQNKINITKKICIKQIIFSEIT